MIIRESSQSLLVTAFIVIFLTVELLGFLLTLAYPYGFNNVETSSWWMIATNFQFLAANYDDFWRTVPAGWVLKASAIFPNPSIAVFWLNNSLFAINMGLLFLLGARLFRSVRLGLILLTTVLCVEIVSAHTFYFSLQMCSDPIYSALLTLGCLLILCAYAYERFASAFVGYAVLGLASFTKPVGMSLFPLCIPVAWLICNRIVKVDEKGKSLRTALLTGALTLVLIAPMSLWVVRNYAIFGRAEPSAYKGMFLLCKALPLMKDNDRVLDDPVLNERFIRVTRDFERTNNIVHRPNPTAKERYWTFDWYLPWRQQAYGPFDFLADTFLGQPLDRHNAKGYFDVAVPAGQIGLRIMRAHPFETISTVAVEYFDMFNPLTSGEVIGLDSEKVQANPEVAYAWMVQDSWKDYPPGWIDVSKANRTACRIWSAICNNAVVTEVASLYYRMQFFVFHTIMIVAALVWGRTYRRGCLIDSVQPKREIAFSILFLGAVTMLHYWFVSMAIVSAMRYMLAGELTMRISTWLALFSLGICVWRWSVRHGKEPAVSQGYLEKSTNA